MRTEITKTYSWGFVATEQDFRRLIQTATDHLLKPVGAALEPSRYTVKLKDGAIVETATLDDIFQIENIGNKLIREISTELSSTHPVGRCAIQVDLVDGAANEKSWNSATYTVSGDTRDWAFVAAAELDERLKRMRVFAWEAIFASKLTTLLAMLAAMVMALVGASYFKPPDKTHVELETMYKAGKLSNATEALIALERIKANRSEIDLLLPLMSMWVVMAIVFFGAAYLLPRLSPSYNFCWGEYTTYYEKRVRLRTAVFTLVVVALVVSIVANFVSKKLGI